MWSKDLDRADRVARRISAGSVSINNVMGTQGNPGLPFGGVRDSGFGRYKGIWGLHAFSNIKAVLVDRQLPRIEPYWYPYSVEKYNLLSNIVDSVFNGGPLGILKTMMTALKLELLNRKHHL